MKKLNRIIKLCFFSAFLFLQIGLPAQLFGQRFQFTDNFKRDRLSFVSVKNMIIIPVYINDKGPFNFILDTGVDPLIIVDSTILDLPQRNLFRSVKVNGHGEGEDISAYISNRIKAGVGHSFMENIPTIILKEDVFNLSSYLGIKIHGLLGYYFFNSFTVRINYAQNRLMYWLPDVKKKVRGDRIALEILDNKPYINTQLEAQGTGKINAKLIVDCGASHAISLEAHNGSGFPLPETSFKANLGVGLSGKINGNIGRISSLTLGHYELKNVLSSFPDFNDVAAKTRQKQRTGNLGANVLKKFNVVFDYTHQAMYLKKNAYFNEPFEHDMSGMELYADNQLFNRIFVSRVEPASPAEKAGIQANDEILSVNFMKVQDYTLEALANLLKSVNGRTILVEYARNDKIYIKLLSLKRRL